MTEFKQIIGRGTRIDEDYEKFYFTIMDFRKATELFADPDFDGEPVQIYEPDGDDPIGAARRGDASDRRRAPTSVLVDPEPVDDGRRRRRAMRTAARTASQVRRRRRAGRVVAERVQYYGKDGKLVTESLRDYTRNAVHEEYAIARRRS